MERYLTSADAPAAIRIGSRCFRHYLDLDMDGMKREFDAAFGMADRIEELLDGRRPAHGIDGPGCDAVAGDVVGGQLDRQGPDQAFQSGFRGRDMAAVRGADPVGNTGQGDDRAAAAPDHMWHRGSAEQKGAIEGDRQDLAPLGEVHFQERCLAAQSGVAHHDVDAAERFGRLGDQGVDGGGVGHVAQMSDSAPSGSCDLSGDVLNRRLVAAAVDQDRGTVGGQSQGDFAADVLAGPGHDGDLTVECGHGFPHDLFGQHRPARP